MSSQGPNDSEIDKVALYNDLNKLEYKESLIPKDGSQSPNEDENDNLLPRKFTANFNKNEQPN